MASFKIDSVPASIEDGEITTLWVPDGGIADISAPTADELNKDTNLDLSPYLTGTGWALTHGQNSTNDDREAWLSVGTIPGSDTYSNPSLQIVNNVNRANGVDADQQGSETTNVPNAAFETLKRGTRGYFVRRRGVGSGEPFKAGQVVSVFKVIIGITTPVAHAANARQMSTVHFSVDPSSQDETAVVAAGAAGASA